MILWRFLIFSYCRTFFLSVATFVSVLLVSRFKEIARFASLCTDQLQTAIYTVYQIPFILPMAIPLSAFIASFLLFLHLSRSSELTAIRASGVSLKKILTPLLFTSTLFAMANFAILADIAPFCRQESRDILFKKTTVNPLLLLQRQHLLNRHHGYLSLDVEGNGASDFRFITYNDHRLSLITARKLAISGAALFGQDVSIVSYLPGDPNQFDPLIIENQETISTETALFLSKLQKNRHKLDGSGLSLKMLRVRMGLQSKISKSALVEILRRLSLSLSVISLTLLGCLFGIEQSRTPSKRPATLAFALTLLLLSSFFLGKNLRYQPLLALLAYFLPHLFIWIACLFRGRSIARGAA